MNGRIGIRISVALAAALTLSACQTGAKDADVLPSYTVQQEKFAETPPAPEAIAADDKISNVTVDTVTIEPEKAVGYENVPPEVATLFNDQQTTLSMFDVIYNTVANNRALKVEAYTWKIAQYDIPVNKSIYDLLLSASASLASTVDNPSSSGDGDDTTKTRSRRGQVALSQLFPTGATLTAGYTAVRSRFRATQTTTNIPTSLPPIDPLNPQAALSSFLGALTPRTTSQNVTTYANTASLGVTQPLLRGFGPSVVNAGIRIAQLENQGAAADFQTRLHNQIAGALSLYWELIGAIEEFKVRVISFSAAQDLLRINRAKFEVGTIPRTEVLQAEAAVEGRREEVIRARQTVRDIEDDLKRQIFIQPDMPLWKTQITPSQPFAWREISLDEDQTIALALDRRPEMRRARSNAEQAQTAEGVAKNNKLPQLDVYGDLIGSGGGDDFDESSRGSVDSDGVGYEVGVQFSYPLQNRRARYEHKQAQARVLQAQELELDQRDQITLEVRRALRSLRTARERISVTQAQVASEQAKVEAETKRYDVGISTAFEVLTFQEDLANAQSQHLSAVVDYNTAAIELERARGTMLATYGIQVEGDDLQPEVESILFPIGFN